MLGNKINPVFTIVVSPAVHFGDIAKPVAVAHFNWGGPLKGIAFPGVLGLKFPAFPNAVEKVENKQQLKAKTNNGGNGNYFIEVAKLLK